MWSDNPIRVIHGVRVRGGGVLYECVRPLILKKVSMVNVFSSVMYEVENYIELQSQIYRSFFYG